MGTQRVLLGGCLVACLALAAEKSWEQKFREIPQPAKVREYIRVFGEHARGGGEDLDSFFGVFFCFWTEFFLVVAD